MDLCFKLNYSFIWKRHSREGGKKRKKVFIHVLAHMRTYTDTLTQTQTGICAILSPHTPPSAFQAERTGEPGCVKEVCISLHCWLYQRASCSDLFLSLVLSGVSVHGWGGLTSLPYTNTAEALRGPCRQHSGKIGFPPMAIRCTVKADSSLLTKA